MSNNEKALAFYNSGDAHYDNGEYDKAIEDFTRAIELDPNYAKAYNLRGLSYGQKHDFEKKVADCSQAIRLDPNYVVAYCNRASAYGLLGDFANQMADCNRAIELDPNRADSYLSRALAHENNGDLDAAIADYNRLIELKPSASAYANRAGVYGNKGDTRKAISDFTTALGMDPQYNAAYYYRGNFYAKIGEFDNAIADFSKFIQLNPINTDTNKTKRAMLSCVYASRGGVYTYKGDFEQAIADFENAMRIDPNDPSNDSYKEEFELAQKMRDELSAIETVIDKCEKDINTGAISAESFKDDISRATKGVIDMPTLLAKGMELRNGIKDKLNKIDILRLKDLKTQYPDNQRISKLACRGANCYMTMLETGFLATEMNLPQKLKAQVQAENRKEMDKIRESCSDLLSSDSLYGRSGSPKKDMAKIENARQKPVREKQGRMRKCIGILITACLSIGLLVWLFVSHYYLLANSILIDFTITKATSISVVIDFTVAKATSMLYAPFFVALIIREIVFFTMVRKKNNYTYLDTICLAVDFCYMIGALIVLSKGDMWGIFNSFSDNVIYLILIFAVIWFLLESVFTALEKKQRMELGTSALLSLSIILIALLPFYNDILLYEGGGVYINDSDSFTDSRDGKTYRTIKIGEQTWMAENLNYEMDNSSCYGNDSTYCDTYGRLYDWNTAIKVCPLGWRLPDSDDWATLSVKVPKPLRGTQLKASNGWNQYENGNGKMINGNGNNKLRFSALPGGAFNDADGFTGIGEYGYWWMVTEGAISSAYRRYIGNDGHVQNDYRPKINKYSVRCIKD